MTPGKVTYSCGRNTVTQVDKFKASEKMDKSLSFKRIVVHSGYLTQKLGNISIKLRSVNQKH